MRRAASRSLLSLLVCQSLYVCRSNIDSVLEYQFILTWSGKMGKRLIVYTLQVVKTIPSFHSAQSNSTQPRANRNADRTSTGQSVVRKQTPAACLKNNAENNAENIAKDKEWEIGLPFSGRTRMPRFVA
jgi:hypothetical protein